LEREQTAYFFILAAWAIIFIALAIGFAKKYSAVFSMSILNLVLFRRANCACPEGSILQKFKAHFGPYFFYKNFIKKTKKEVKPC
jgi:hypothetical protein